MKNLIEQLKEQTTELRIAFVEKSAEWAGKEFDRLSATTEKETINDYGYMSHYTNTMRHTKASFARWGRIQKIVYGGREAYLDRKHLEAKQHYEDSIEKLAGRIAKKGLDLSSITLSTESHIQVGNITTKITDGSGKTITAWTILAWGEVNAPHYRYLIK